MPANYIHLTPQKADPAHLQSRANALHRRCTLLATNLTHLTAVLDPLCKNDYRSLTEAQIRDMHQEAVYVYKAMGALKEQLKEVGTILDEVERRRKGKEDNKDEIIYVKRREWW